ncbi:MAG: DNA-protecting protein DprA, partial [Planctomycetota bacterium]|nr:DNA-protecting protein DprA [Planctomycetota bacterium]
VDSSAHRGAMSHPQGRTIAVLGSGIDVPYPPENAGLFEQIAAKGAVVSEYSLGTSPMKENFPRRNRIVSGLSRGVLVIEADERSGALITARQACDDHGRTVFALPGRVDNPTSAGPHKLIRDGATLVTKLEDILEELGPLPQEAHEETLFHARASAKPQAAETDKPAPNPNPTLTDRQRVILAQLDGEPVHIDTLIDRTSLAPSEILQDLTLLSLKGVVKRVDGQTFVRAAGRSS